MDRSIAVQRDTDKVINKATKMLARKRKDIYEKVKEIKEEFPQNPIHELLTSRELRSSVAGTRRWMKIVANV